MDRNFVPKVTELAEFFPELDQKTSSKMKLVENDLRDSTKIVPLNPKNGSNDDSK